MTDLLDVLFEVDTLDDFRFQCQFVDDRVYTLPKEQAVIYHMSTKGVSLDDVWQIRTRKAPASILRRLAEVNGKATKHSGIQWLFAALEYENALQTSYKAYGELETNRFLVEFSDIGSDSEINIPDGWFHQVQLPKMAKVVCGLIEVEGKYSTKHENFLSLPEGTEIPVDSVEDEIDMYTPSLREIADKYKTGDLLQVLGLGKCGLGLCWIEEYKTNFIVHIPAPNNIVRTMRVCSKRDSVLVMEELRYA